MPIIQKAIYALALATGGAALAATGDATGAIAVGTVAGSLCTAIAGTLGHEVFNAAGDRAASMIIGRHPEIEENHHVLLGLRTAHLDALDAVLRRYDKGWASMGDSAVRAESKRISDNLHAFIRQAREISDSSSVGAPPSNLEREVFEQLPEAFTSALSARTAIVTDMDQVRTEIEDAVLAEIAAEIGTEHEPLPPALVRAFRGADNDGWFDLFVRAGVAALKSNQTFAAIWLPEQIAALRAKARQMLEASNRIEMGVQKLDRKLDDLTKAIGNISSLMEDVLQIQRRIQGESTELRVPISNEFKLNELGQGLKSIDRSLLENVFNGYDRIKVINKVLLDEKNYRERKNPNIKLVTSKIDADRKRAILYFERAEILRIASDRKGAVKSLLNGLSLDPSAAKNWIILGNIYLTTGDSASAKLAFQFAMAVDQGRLA